VDDESTKRHWEYDLLHALIRWEVRVVVLAVLISRVTVRLCSAHIFNQIVKVLNGIYEDIIG